MEESIDHTLLLIIVDSISIASITSIKRRIVELHYLCLIRVYVLIVFPLDFGFVYIIIESPHSIPHLRIEL